MKASRAFISIVLLSSLGLFTVTLVPPGLTQPEGNDTIDSAALSAPLPGLYVNQEQKVTVVVPKILEKDNSSTTANEVVSFNKASPLKSEVNSDNFDKIQSLGPINLHKVIPILMETSINSKTVRVGDRVMAKLKEDLYYGRHLIAPANSILVGSVTSCRIGRTLGSAAFQREDRLKSNAAVGIQFGRLITNQSYALSLFGLPVRQESIHLGSDGFCYGIAIDHHGKIVQAGRTLSKNQQDTGNALRIASNAPIPGNFFVGVAAAPFVMGAIGAAYPEIALNKPLDPSVSHKRLKGMAYGFATNIPGAFFVQSMVEKGNEISLNTGDEIMIDLTVNGQTFCQPLRPAIPDTLIVKAELLTPASTMSSPGKNNRMLPLKPLIDSPDSAALASNDGSN